MHIRARSSCLFGHPQRKLGLPNFSSHPFSLVSEIEDLKSIDIGIMPMPDNEWTRGKCAFKAIQYMALGIPAVCSPIGMTTELVQHGLNGFCARTPAEWFTALNRIITDDCVGNLRSPGEKLLKLVTHYKYGLHASWSC